VTKKEFNVRAVGHVHIDGDDASLKILKEYAGALEGVEGFSHVWVVFWCDRVDRDALRNRTICEKPYVKGPDRLGLWATRSEVRPNPIAITPVPVISVDVVNGIIRIPFIDAEDGTPILDIKPYHPTIDRIRNTNRPDWCRHWPEWYEDSAGFDWSAEFNCP
jgi:tRNA-Thr(GGU) m(6)t(6)A37 methyltransferase TsaA